MREVCAGLDFALGMGVCRTEDSLRGKELGASRFVDGASHIVDGIVKPETGFHFGWAGCECPDGLKQCQAFAQVLNGVVLPLSSR